MCASPSRAHSNIYAWTTLLLMMVISLTLLFRITAQSYEGKAQSRWGQGLLSDRKMQEDFAPRVDVAHLGHFQGQVVRVVGRVVSQSGSTATLNCADSGNKSVQVQTTYGNEYNSPIVEVKGRVAGDIVEEISHVPLGENFDLANYQRLLEFSSGPFKHLFLPV